MRAFILRRVELIAHGLGDVVLVGSSHCAGTLRVKEFLTRNGHPYTYVDLDRDADVQALLDRFSVTAADVPVLICRGEVVLRNPTNQQIAECLGFNAAIDQTHVRDVVIVGAGPAGLAAAVYGASEGLDVLVLESQLAGRPGRLELEDRELSRLSDRHLGPGARGPRLRAGAEVRRPGDDRARRHAARLRPQAVRRRDRRSTCACRRAPSSSRPARSTASRRSTNLSQLRGRGRVLRRDVHGGAVVRRRRSHRRRRRQLGRPGRRVPGADGEARAHAGARGGLAETHVALPDPPHRGEPRDRPAHATRRSSRSRAATISSACAGATVRPARSRPTTSATCSS